MNLTFTEHTMLLVSTQVILGGLILANQRMSLSNFISTATNDYIHD